MPGELEDAKYAEDSQSDEGTTNVVVFWEAQSDVIGQNGNDVDYTHHRPSVPIQSYIHAG